MKQLELEFVGKGQVRGFKFTQLKKTQYAYLYEVNTGDSLFFEIFEHKENTQYNCISYPSNKAFGIWAKTTNNYQKAIDLLEEIDLKVYLRKEGRNGTR